MRRCPRCTYPLMLFVHEGEELDHCRRCGGNFLDPGEAERLFGAHAGPDQWRESFAAKSKGETDLLCPKDRTPMEAFEVEFEKDKVEVDLCARCAGLWLDGREGFVLQRIVQNAEVHAEQRASGQIKPGAASYVFQLLTGFPVEAWNPVKRTPYVVYTLLVVLVVTFLAQITLMPNDPKWLAQYGGFFFLVPSEFIHGEHIWTIITCAFFHGGFMHLAGNAYFLWIFGDNVEDELGATRFITLYVISMICGSLLHFAFNADSSIPMLGASGAIAGVMGAYLVLFPKVKLYVMIVVFRLRIGVYWYLGFWIAYQLVMFAMGGQGVAWLAHAGGFFAGAICAWIFKGATDHETKVAV
ncbi:MAG: rhomboid family intramembrane serine protease [Deltaproteobacteria bacterium]|jgi:membrane associated rhomboid family serine protease/Zn-finger nucleic acid-binding protein